MTDCTYEQLKSALEASSAGCPMASGNRVSSPSRSGRSSSRRLDGPHRSPVPGQQVGKARARPALGQAIDDIGEVSLRIESVESRRFDNRIYVRGAPAAFVAAQEKKILPCDRNLALILPISGRMSSSIIAGIHCTGAVRIAFSVCGAHRASLCMWSWRPAS